MRILRSAVTAALLLTGACAMAQFTPGGGEPARLRWYRIESPNYRVIYPSGSDSLARTYAESLERFRAAEAPTIGLLPGGLHHRKTSVILHALSGKSNGSVIWAPSRMDLYVNPQPYGSDPYPWASQLAVHESRHLAQMQFGYRGAFKPFGWILGEMWQGALAAVYPNQALLEGDAVVAETALTLSGRGRTADFLNYYMTAFDAGDFRDWYRWRYGSFRRYAPDHYALGYMTIAGMRYFYDAPYFMKDYFLQVTEHPLRIGGLQKTVKNISGKRFRDTYVDIMKSFHSIWKEEAAARAPFMPSDQVTPAPSWYSEYTGTVFADGRHYVLRKAIDRPVTLATVLPDGSLRDAGAFSGSASRLRFSPGRHRLYWSETVSDIRWSQKQKSVIRYMDTSDGSRHDLTSEGKYYNPYVSPDESRLSAVEYRPDGESRIVVLDAGDGAVLHGISMPDSLQATESAWLGDKIYFFAVSGHGFGIYAVPEDCSARPEEIIPPAVVKLRTINAADGCIEFVSDLNGVNEFYRLDPENRRITRLTSTPYGGEDFCLNDRGDSLYYSAVTHEGRLIFRTAVSDLKPVEADFSAPHRYPVADGLSAQEREAGSFDDMDAEVEISAPERYGKLSHLLRLHSWAPVFVEYNSIRSQSMDMDFSPVSLGAMGFFQNDLGSFYGYAGYSARKDPFGSSWKHSLHANFTYNGFYPVIEASVDFNDRNARQIYRTDVTDGNMTASGTTSRLTEAPYAEGELSLYVPLDFSKDGWRRGLVPQLRYSLCNDFLNTSAAQLAYSGYFEGDGTMHLFPSFTGVSGGRNIPVQRLSVSVRGYSMRPVASSQTYPSLGIGAEIGASVRPGLLSVYNPSVYVYLYGYLPGFVPRQGLRLTAIVQHMHEGDGIFGENVVSCVPRGCSAEMRSSFSSQSPTQFKLTADYMIPVYVGDISFLSPVAYIKNFELGPFADFSYNGKSSLFSAGMSVTARLANFLWIPFGGSAGIRTGVCSGRRVFAEAIFSFDM